MVTWKKLEDVWGRTHGTTVDYVDVGVPDFTAYTI